MTSAHHFINISQNILNLWMRLIFPKTRHPGIWAQEWGNSDQNWVRYDFSKLTLYAVIAVTGKSNFACSSLSSIFTFNAQISLKTKMRSRFMILYQPSLNGLSFMFPSPLLYKPPLSFIPRHKKTLPLFSSLHLSSAEVE